jgi:hypothetical protein
MTLASMKEQFEMHRRTINIASYAGLPRVSIPSSKQHFAKWMDCRVKPGNDNFAYPRFDAA